MSCAPPSIPKEPDRIALQSPPLGAPPPSRHVPLYIMPGRSGPGGDIGGGPDGGGGGGGGDGPGPGFGGGPGPGFGGGAGPGFGGGAGDGFHGATTMEVKLMSVVHLVAGHCGPASLEGSAQRCAKSHSLNHAHIDSKGVPESFLILG